MQSSWQLNSSRLTSSHTHSLTIVAQCNIIIIIQWQSVIENLMKNLHCKLVLCNGIPQKQHCHPTQQWAEPII